jgi:hypothetical protein
LLIGFWRGALNCTQRWNQTYALLSSVVRSPSTEPVKRTTVIQEHKHYTVYKNETLKNTRQAKSKNQTLRKVSDVIKKRNNKEFVSLL